MKNSLRKNVVALFFIAVSIIFLVKLFYIQVLNEEYKFSAKNNVLRYDVLQPVRGLVFDRDSNLIVSNEPAFDIIVVPREVTKIDTTVFCNSINIPKADFIEKLNSAIKYSKYRESIFEKQIDAITAANFREKLYQFPGFYLRKVTKRIYPHKKLGHLIGFMGEVNAKKMKEDNFYIKGDLHGVSGIEASYENKLRGEKGMSIRLVDVHNRTQGKFNNGEYDTLAIRGKNLISTIDIELQNYGNELLNDKLGSIVAINPKNGEILSLISSPNFDPEKLSGKNRSNNYKKLINKRTKPMFNRALLGEYPPGSTFKIINSLICLQEKTLNVSNFYNCDGKYFFEKDRSVKCHKHKSMVNLSDAIKYSCNTFFCENFEKYFNKFDSSEKAYKNWFAHVTSFGIGDWMNNDFFSGRKGLLPKADYYNNYYGKNNWNSSTIISMSIGQGELLITPIQLANVSAIIANRGFFYTPHIIKTIENELSIDSNFINKKFCSIDEEHFKYVIEGMFDVVNSKNGTAYNPEIERFNICGKTGTAQNPHGDDHSIYIAFAPKNDPEIAIAVFIENAGWGSKWAAPIGNNLIQKYFELKDK